MINKFSLEKLESTKIDTVLVSILLVVGIYLPSSINSNMMPPVLVLMHYGILGFICMYLLYKYRFDNKYLLYMFILINISLIYSTLGSHFIYKYPITAGAYLPYFIISIIYLINLKSIKLEHWIKKVFNIINIVNIVFCFLIIVGNRTVQKFFYDFYLNFYREILIYMMQDNKPVLTFVSHSIAALYMFIFFYLNYYSYTCEKNKLNAIFAFCYMLILFFMTSNTGYIFLVISILILLFDYLKKIKKADFKEILKNNKILIIVVLIVLAIGIIFLLSTPLAQSYIERMKHGLGSNFNGFKGRFGSDLFASDIEYIKNNFLLPVGITFSDGLHYTDNGFIVTMLRGGLLLIIGMYYGLYIFLKSNIIDKKCRNYIFFAFIIFEVAHPNLEFSRTLYLLPFIVVYLNYLSRIRQEK